MSLFLWRMSSKARLNHSECQQLKFISFSSLSHIALHVLQGLLAF
jgi:hypothetical protein